MRLTSLDTYNGTGPILTEYKQIFNLNAGWTVGEISPGKHLIKIQRVSLSDNFPKEGNDFFDALARASDPWDRQIIKDVQDGSIDRLLAAMAEEDDKLEEF